MCRAEPQDTLPHGTRNSTRAAVSGVPHRRGARVLWTLPSQPYSRQRGGETLHHAMVKNRSKRSVGAAVLGPVSRSIRSSMHMHQRGLSFCFFAAFAGPFSLSSVSAPPLLFALISRSPSPLSLLLPPKTRFFFRQGQKPKAKKRKTKRAKRGATPAHGQSPYTQTQRFGSDYSTVATRL